MAGDTPLEMIARIRDEATPVLKNLNREMEKFGKSTGLRDTRDRFKELHGVTEKLGHELKHVFSPALTTVGLTSLSAGAAIGAMIEKLTEVGKSAVQLKYLSGVTGASTGQIETLSNAMEHLGTDSSITQAAFENFSKTMDELHGGPMGAAVEQGQAMMQKLQASGKFGRELAGAMREVTKNNPKDGWTAMMTALEMTGTRNPREQARLLQILGLPKEWINAREQIRKQPLVINTAEAEERALHFNKTMKDLTQHFNEFWKNMVLEAAPAITGTMHFLDTFMEKLDELKARFSKEGKTSADIVPDLVEDVWQKLQKQFPDIGPPPPFPPEEDYDRGRRYGPEKEPSSDVPKPESAPFAPGEFDYDRRRRRGPGGDGNEPVQPIPPPPPKMEQPAPRKSSMFSLPTDWLAPKPPNPDEGFWSGYLKDALKYGPLALRTGAGIGPYRGIGGRFARNPGTPTPLDLMGVVPNKGVGTDSVIDWDKYYPKAKEEGAPQPEELAAIKRMMRPRATFQRVPMAAPHALDKKLQSSEMVNRILAGTAEKEEKAVGEPAAPQTGDDYGWMRDAIAAEAAKRKRKRDGGDVQYVIDQQRRGDRPQSAGMPEWSRLDRALQGQVAVGRFEGGATIDVNVNAPRGTNVDASSKGMFKPPSIERSWSQQMGFSRHVGEDPNE